jgi:hypothetical protein
LRYTSRVDRTAWTDERLDEKMAAHERLFELLHDDLRALREEMRGMRSDFARFQDRQVQVGFGLVFVLISALAAGIIAVAI